MMRVLLLISDGSWLLLLTAENATLELAARTEMPSGDEEPLESVAGFESHTTKHFPSSTMGSVSFCAVVSATNASTPSHIAAELRGIVQQQKKYPVTTNFRKCSTRALRCFFPFLVARASMISAKFP